MDGGAGWQSTVLSNTIVVAATASQPDLIWRGWADKQQRRCVVGTAWAFEKVKRHGKKRNQNPSSSSQCRGGRELQTEDCIIEVGGGGCGGGDAEESGWTSVVTQYLRRKERKRKERKEKKGKKKYRRRERGRGRVRNTIVGGGAAGSGVRGPFQPKQTLGN